MHLFGIRLFLLILGAGQHAAGNPTQCQDMCADPHIGHGNAITPDVDDPVFHVYDYYQLFHNDTNLAVQCDNSYWFTGTNQRNGTMRCRVENCEARWDPSEKEACRAAECSPDPFYGGFLKPFTGRFDLPCTVNSTDLDTPITAKKSACLVCHPGFKIMIGDFKTAGPVRVWCGPDGKWDAPFQCKNQIDCQRPSPEDLSRRFVRILSFDARDQMHFECIRDDFLMFGDPVVRCQNGNWSLPLPVCRFKWSCLLSISKGSVIRIPTARPPLGPWARNNDYGVAHCKPGYTISTGDGRIKCNKGNWDPQPICLVIDCGDPGPMYNGYLGPGGTIYGEQRSFRCNARTTMEPEINDPHRTILCLNTSQWSRPLPTCWGKCLVPRFVDHGYHTRSGVLIEHEEETTISCDRRYTTNIRNPTERSKTRQCWNGTLTIASCTEKPCTKLSESSEGLKNAQYTPADAEIDGTDLLGSKYYTHGTEVRTTCKDTHETRPGNRVISSQFSCDKGEWSGKSSPICLQRL